MIERPVDPQQNTNGEDEQLEFSLRPKRFDEYIGQEQIKKSLHLAIAAARSRGDSLDHVLLYGPPGLGKTTLAHVIGHEMGASVKITSGPAIERAGDLAAILTNMERGEILFVDEIHRLPRGVEEILYSAMEDYVIDIMLGKGPSAQTVRLDLPRFTIIGATTRFGALSGPLRDRFGLVHRLDYYTTAEIGQILNRSARLMALQIEPPAVDTLSARARLTPRIANRLIRRVRDYAQVHGDGVVSRDLAEQTLELLEVDQLGLDKSDRQLLRVIIEHYEGGPAGVDAIAAAISEERQTIEDVYEPYLIQIGLLTRTSRGRKVTSKAYQHLNIGSINQSNQAKLL